MTREAQVTGPPDTAREPGLDLLRGTAALSVVAFHLWLYATPKPPARGGGLLGAVWSSGRLGLVLFFVLSGYLLYRPWVHAARGRRLAPSPLGFMRRRAARILPAYYAALAGALVLLHGARDVPGVRLPPVEKLPLFVVFGQNLDPATIMKLDPPMWTLVVEVCFYLLLPALGAAAVMLRRGAIIVPLGTLLAGLGYCAWLTGQGLSQPWTKALPALLPLFAVGMFAAHVPVNFAAARSQRLTLLLAAAALIAMNVVWHRATNGGVALVVRDLPAATGFALALMAIRDITPKRPAGRALALTGAVSFGLYLWHVPVLWALRANDLLPLDPLHALPVVLAPSLLIAWASWRWIEQPWLTRRRTPTRPRQVRPAAVTPPA